MGVARAAQASSANARDAAMDVAVALACVRIRTGASRSVRVGRWRRVMPSLAVALLLRRTLHAGGRRLVDDHVAAAVAALVRRRGLGHRDVVGGVRRRDDFGRLGLGEDVGGVRAHERGVVVLQQHTAALNVG